MIPASQIVPGYDEARVRGQGTRPGYEGIVGVLVPGYEGIVGVRGYSRGISSGIRGNSRGISSGV